VRELRNVIRAAGHHVRRGRSPSATCRRSTQRRAAAQAPAAELDLRRYGSLSLRDFRDQI